MELTTSVLRRLTPWRGFKVLRACLPLTAVAMEFCWVYPWILLMTGLFYGRAPIPLLPAPLTFGLLLLGHLTVRAATAQPRPLRWARAGVVGAGLLAGMSAVKLAYYPGSALWDPRWVLVLLRAAHDAFPVVVPAVVGALTATALWWRGVVLGEREFTHSELDYGFRRGVAWSVVFVVLFALYGDSVGFVLTGPAATYLLGFLSLSLVALAVARLVGIWEESQADEDQALAMNRHWLLLLLILVGLIFLTATLLSGLISVDFWSPLFALLRPLAPVVEFIFLIIFAIASVIVRAILAVLSRFRPIQPPAPRPPGAADPFADFLRRIQEMALPPRMVSGARWGMVLAVVTVLLVLVAISVVRGRRRRRRGDEDERESVWSTSAALAGLGGMLHAVWRRHQPPEVEREQVGVSTIRALYRELLGLGVRLGVPRHRYQTPYEYLPRIVGRVPGRDRELGTMTNAYVRVRYTPHVPNTEEIAEVRGALERIRDRVESIKGGT